MKKLREAEADPRNFVVGNYLKNKLSLKNSYGSIARSVRLHSKLNIFYNMWPRSCDSGRCKSHGGAFEARSFFVRGFYLRTNTYEILRINMSNKRYCISYMLHEVFFIV